MIDWVPKNHHYEVFENTVHFFNVFSSDIKIKANIKCILKPMAHSKANT